MQETFEKIDILIKQNYNITIPSLIFEYLSPENLDFEINGLKTFYFWFWLYWWLFICIPIKLFIYKFWFMKSGIFIGLGIIIFCIPPKFGREFIFWIFSWRLLILLIFIPWFIFIWLYCIIILGGKKILLEFWFWFPFVFIKLWLFLFEFKLFILLLLFVLLIRFLLVLIIFVNFCLLLSFIFKEFRLWKKIRKSFPFLEEDYSYLFHNQTILQKKFFHIFFEIILI